MTPGSKVVVCSKCAGRKRFNVTWKDGSVSIVNCPYCERTARLAELPTTSRTRFTLPGLRSLNCTVDGPPPKP